MKPNQSPEATYNEITSKKAHCPADTDYCQVSNQVQSTAIISIAMRVLVYDPNPICIYYRMIEMINNSV